MGTARPPLVLATTQSKRQDRLEQVQQVVWPPLQEASISQWLPHLATPNRISDITPFTEGAPVFAVEMTWHSP